jgi:uncharacterized pyridoxal phosphate-containing UPF0001 family protein
LTVTQRDTERESQEINFMVDIVSNIRLLRQGIPSSVKIVAVSKTKPVEDICRQTRLNS